MHANSMQKLVRLAYHRYGKVYPQEAYETHFHHTCAHSIVDQRCEARIDEVLYDLGEYFDERYMQAREAVFVRAFRRKDSSWGAGRDQGLDSKFS